MLFSHFLLRNFNPRSPCGERPAFWAIVNNKGNFNPRSPCGERPNLFHYKTVSDDFNPRSPCGERLGGNIAAKGRHIISIHAPRVGSDCRSCCSKRQGTGFQSTLPVWGATIRPSPSVWRGTYFNPRSPCGERLVLYRDKLPKFHFNPRSPCGERLIAVHSCWMVLIISIHAPRVGSDLAPDFSEVHKFCISIHAPRVGSDP